MKLASMTQDWRASEPARMSAPPRLHIAVMGGLTLTANGQALPLTKRKARAVIAYLALEDAPAISRERLAGLFWSESDDRAARNSLRQTLHEIRDALAGTGLAVLHAGREEVALRREAVALDLDAALDMIGAGQLPDRMLAAESGPEMLLAGYEDLTPAFDDWLATARRAALARMLRALERGYTAPGNSRALRRRMAEATVALDPLHEAACRAVMQLAAEDGEIGVALRAYAALYEVMGDQLDMEPSDATQALVAKVKQGHLEAPPPPPSVALPTRARAALAGVPIVAVLPLLPVGDDPMLRWVADGVVEDVVRVLAGLREPMVISSNSTRQLSPMNVDLQQVATQLGAQYLVTGSVRMAGGRGRISVELTEASNGVVLWGQAYNFTTETIFDAQEQIAAAIANTLTPQVNAAELRLSRRQRPDDLGAYHLLLQAKEPIFQLDRSSFAEAGAAVHDVARRNPDYAEAQATLANWFSLRVFQGWSTDRDADVASLLAAAGEAIRLDPQCGRALALFAHNIMLAQHRHDEARALLAHAVEVAPNDAETLNWSGPTLAYTGAAPQAIDHCERAMLLSPQDPLLYRYQHFLSIAYYAADDADAAIDWGLRGWRANPNYTSNLRLTIAALGRRGRKDDARPLIAALLALQPDFSAGALAARNPFRDKLMRKRIESDFLAAGLPP